MGGYLPSNSHARGATSGFSKSMAKMKKKYGNPKKSMKSMAFQNAILKKYGNPKKSMAKVWQPKKKYGKSMAI